MRFIPINKENQEFYQEFQNAQDLSLYMSRIYPDRDSAYLKWMYIEEDQHYIGSVWLEGKDIHIVKLGIFIAEPSYRNKGIGKQAIRQMIDIAEGEGIHLITLNVRADNIPARNVYATCGFKIKKRFTKKNGIDAFSMELEL